MKILSESIIQLLELGKQSGKGFGHNIKIQTWKGSHMPTKISWKKNVNNLILASSKNVLSVCLCLTLCNPLDHRLPGSSVHRILQARILE